MGPAAADRRRALNGYVDRVLRPDDGMLVVGRPTLSGVSAASFLASMFMPMVKPVSYEDFFGEYHGAEGRPEGVEQLPTLTAWFFQFPAAVTLAHRGEQQ